MHGRDGYIESKLQWSINSIIHGDSYASCGLPIRKLNAACLLLSHHWWRCLDLLVAVFVYTTETSNHSNQRDSSYSSLCLFLTKVIGLFCCLTILFPFAVVSLFIWVPLQFLRPRSYCYYSAWHACQSDTDGASIDYQRYSGKRNFSNFGCNLPETIKSLHEKTFTVITGNVCLMPEFLAKMNNVSNTVERAEKMARLLCRQHSTLEGVSSPSLEFSKDKELDAELPVKDNSDSSYGSEVISPEAKAISNSFPAESDFLCLQEVFDQSAASALLNVLGSKYPHIIYDVTWPLQSGRIKLLNSGLCIASKFPFLNIAFKSFPCGYREDQLACKGLLMTKINLGESGDGRCHVGYLATTHLQAISHSKASEVRCKQLYLIQDWLDQFQQRNQKSNDVVMFDIICGDFNFDPESHFEQNERNCDFNRTYKDPCIDDSGQQHNWVIGTELKAKHLHDYAINSANGLQRMLVSELQRPRYVASTLPTNSENTQPLNGKRRIDYILYKECNNKKMVIKDYKFITGFAALTDHIPVAMSFSSQD